MKLNARALKDEPILVDRAVNYFGGFGEAFTIRSRLRGAGVLTLTEDRLTYHQDKTGTHIEIPLEEIQRIALSRWPKGATGLVPILKITYSGNLMFGVHVSNPERWVDAIESIASGRGLAPSLRISKSEGERARPIIIFAAIFVFLVGVILFLSLLGGQIKQQTRGPAASTAPGAEGL